MMGNEFVPGGKYSMRDRESVGDPLPTATITLVSTRTIDRLPLPTGGTLDLPGGPANYISDALRRLGRPYHLITGAPTVVEVVLGGDGEEYIIPELQAIPLPDCFKTAAVILSPIMLEIDATKFPPVSGLLVVDVQGFVRRPNTPTGASDGEFDLVELFRRADVVKASPTELQRLSAASRDALTGTMLLVTLGTEGALVRRDGGELRISARPIATPNTIGAGDNFLAAFTHHLLDGLAPEQAAERAARFTEKFLSERDRSG